MAVLQEALPMTLYVLGIILLILSIIIGIKIINTMNKVEVLVDDVNEKVASLGRFFHLIDFTTDKLSFLSDKIVDKISTFIINLFKRKKKKEEEEEDEQED